MPEFACQERWGRYRGVVAGGIVFVLAMVVAIPVGVMIAGALWTAVFGWFASEAAEPEPAPDPEGS
jgi:hypothetical protein